VFPLRPSRILGAAAAVAATVLTVASAPVSAAAAGVRYAALGDSYSSGVGTGNYYASSGSCHRSPQGYPALWAARHRVSSFTFAACAGAKTADVRNNQLGGLSAATTLVSITIGGNDAGFATVLENCILQSDAGCKAAVDSAEAFARTTLPGRLRSVYGAIRRHAPRASVVVLGYPRLYQRHGTCLAGMDEAKRGYLNGGADVLDSVIRTQVGRYRGFRFVDVRAAFAPHEICSPGTWWLHSLELSQPTESYHPTVEGYRYGYLPALASVAG
jgi:lysophospholipase L1-like esterase